MPGGLGVRSIGGESRHSQPNSQKSPASFVCGEWGNAPPALFTHKGARQTVRFAAPPWSWVVFRRVGRALLTQAESLDECTIAFDVSCLEVVQERTALTYEFNK